jgi:hypothetical protein
MNIVWIRKSVNEWISINIDEIKSFSYDSKYKRKFLYINHKLVVSDDELILFKALEKLFKGGRGSKYPFDNSIQEYNIQVYNELIKGVSDD